MKQALLILLAVIIIAGVGYAAYTLLTGPKVATTAITTGSAEDTAALPSDLENG